METAKAQAEELASTEPEASWVGKYPAPSASVRSPLSNRMPGFVEAQNLPPSANADQLPFESLSEGTVKPYGEIDKSLNLNRENWVAGSEWKPKIKQEPGYPSALVSSEMQNEEIRKADFFNSPTSGSLVQRLFEVQH